VIGRLVPVCLIYSIPISAHNTSVVVLSINVPNSLQ
jgi:hypothetical protein